MSQLGRLKSALGTKFGRDVLVSLVSFGVLGVCGLAVNLWIGERFGAGALGVFNQLFAIWVVSSQLAAVGLPLSVLRHVAHDSAGAGKDERGTIFTSALVLSVALGMAATLLSLPLAGPVGHLLGSPLVAEQWPLVAPALLLFTVDRVLAAALNGLRWMGLLAFVNAGRYVVLLLALIGWDLLDLPADRLAATITISEAFAFAILLPACLKAFPLVSLARCREWAARHLRFGSRVVLTDAMTEVNARMVILMLGLGADDAAVGAFSVVVFLLEGFSQVSVVFRNNLNPVMAGMLGAGRTADLEAVVRRGVGYYRLVMAGMAVAVLAGWQAASLFLSAPEFAKVWLPLALGLGGMVMGSGHLPFLMMLAVGGKPTQHLLLNLEIVASLLVLGALLIPPLGAEGAALAYGLVYPLATLRLRQRVRRVWAMSI